MIVLDATQGVTRDDQRIITRVIDAGCGLILLVNKWDLVTGPRQARSPRQTEAILAGAVTRALPFASFAPVLAVSAKTGFQVARGLAKALQVARARRAGLSDPEVLSILKTAWTKQPPPRVRGRLIRLQQARWVVGRPVRVAIVTTPIAPLPPGYQRYLLKQFQASPRCAGVPLQLRVNER